MLSDTTPMPAKAVAIMVFLSIASLKACRSFTLLVNGLLACLTSKPK